MNKAIANCLRKHYAELQGYVSAGMESDKTAEKLFMNANENPFELPGLEGFNRYPEPQPKALADAYAKLYGVKPSHVVSTRGADEAIVVLTKLFCEPQQDAVIICPPTFGMYGVNASAMPCRKLEVPLTREGNSYALNKQAIIAAATDEAQNVKLVYICSPNNPTANSFDHAEIAEIIKALEGHAIVILDETYAEFAEQGSMAKRLEEFPNLIILRTLSKSYALAGLRLGSFLCADEEFVALVKAKALDAYPIPKNSLQAALYVTGDDIQKQAKENIQTLLRERGRVLQVLENSPLVNTVFESDANFVLVEMNEAAAFIEFAKARDVILRDFSKSEHTKDCIRISIGTPEQNDIVLGLLEEFTQQQAA